MVHLQVIDTAESAVVEYQDIYFLSLLHDSHDLTVEHLETGISDNTVYFVVRLGKFHAEGRRHFVSHTGITVLCVITAPLVGSPYSLHTARKRTARRDNGRVLVDHPADCRKGCRLGNLSVRQLHEFRNRSRISCLDDRFKIISRILDTGKSFHLFIPYTLRFFNLACIRGYITSCAELLCQCLNRCSGVSHCLYGVHLVRMIAGIVDGNDLYILIPEESLGACGKIRHSRSDGNHHIRVFRDDIRRISTCHADAAETIRVAGLTCALSSLALSKRNLELLAELFYHFACFRITDAAADDHQRFLRSRDNLCQIFQFLVYSYRSCDSMYTLLEEILREIIRLAFHILTESYAARSRLRRIGQDTHRVNQRRHDHLRPRDSVPVFADRLERVVRGCRQAAALL